MTRIKYIVSLCLFASLFVLASCSNTKYLAEDEYLYVGSKVEIEDSLPKKEIKKLSSELEDIVRPAPNSSFLGLRLKLWVHNVVGETKREKGIKFWLKDKFSEPPVLESDVNLDYNNEILQNYLGNKGYLSAFSIAEFERKKKKTKAIFHVDLNERTYINKIEYEVVDSIQITKHIANTKDKSFLKKEKPYSLETIKAERERISDVLKSMGYYFFSPDHILVLADTSAGDQLLDLKVTLKLDEMPEEAKHPYRMNNIIVQPNYQLSNRSSNRPERTVDTTYYRDFKIVDRTKSFRPNVFYQAMQFSPGELYNKKDHNNSLNRLITLGTFRFVKNEFTIVEDSAAYLLDVNYLLTPAPRKAFNIELGGFGNDENRLGSRATIAWSNKNFLKGAELFTVKLTGGFEKQFGGELKRPNQYNLGIETSLNIPRFMVPFVRIKPSGMFIPRTLINVNYNYNLKQNYSSTNVYTARFGYNWKEDISKEHHLFPISISYVQTDTLTKDDDFTSNLSNLYYNGIIIGPDYEYTYNSQLKGVKKNNFYFNGAADFSGNIIGLIQKADYENNPRRILKSSYAQYVKLQADFRYYHNITDESIIAARVFGGWGYSYGNSYNLPNVKQFYSGGSNSLRGFSSRLVGPGSFHPLAATGKQSFVEMLGDIKMEANLEWRMKLYSFVKGALFVDAGNVWLQRPNEDFPGGEFSKNFLKEVAVSAGAGVRLDFSILILRLDLGFPIRKPWLPENDRWTFNHINFRDAQWRRDNILFNIAIGYPF